MSDHDTHEYLDFAAISHHSEEEGKKIRKVIWNIFWVLLAITTVEVVLGIFYHDWGLPWHLVKMTFIGLTIAKAYYIVAYYMHMKDEWKNFRMAILIPFVLFALYLIYMVLTEAIYQHEFQKLFF